MKKRKKKKRCKKRTTFVFIILILITIFALRVYLDNKDVLYIGGKIEETEEDDGITEESSFPEEVFGIPVYTELIDSGTSARPGTKRKVKYIVIHETDNFTKGTGAKNHAKYLKNTTDSTSWHYTVDDKEIYHHIPDNEIAHHAATEIGNKYGIGVELCVNEDRKF